MNTQIPQSGLDYIKRLVDQEWKDTNHFDTLHFNGITAAERFAWQTYVVSWDLWGYESKWEADCEFKQYITSLRIRKWCRANGYTTRKGTLHTFDGRHWSDRGIWNVVQASGLDNECDGVKWSVRKVDYLKNVYVWFK